MMIITNKTVKVSFKFYDIDLYAMIEVNENLFLGEIIENAKKSINSAFVLDKIEFVNSKPDKEVMV